MSSLASVAGTVERSEHPVARLLNPTSIAVIGASESSLWATEIVQNLRRWGFPGSLHMVHPTRKLVYGEPAYRSLGEIPHHVDHALVLVRAALVPDVLRQCGEAGVLSATVVASGFSEVGADGARLADELSDVCNSYGISVVGPNCYGFTNYARRAVVTRNWVEEAPAAAGGISMVFQSGQLNLSACGSAFQRGIDLRYMVSSGNELVTDANDYFEYFIDDPGTHVLGGALEQIPDPRRFEELALRALDQGKPIVILKLGVSEVGSRIAISHTGSVAGVAEVVDAFLEDLGVITVTSVDELVETAGLLDQRGWPAGRRAVFVGGSGGAGEFFADLAQGTRLHLTDLSESTSDAVAVAADLPSGSLNNPMDLTAAGFGNLPAVTSLLANSGEVDIIVAQGEEPLSREIQGDTMVRLIEGHMDAMAAASTAGSYAVFVSSADRAPTPFGKQSRRDHGVTYLRGATGVAALSNAIRYGETREQARQRIRRILEARARANRENHYDATRFSESGAKEILSSHGLQITRDIRALNADEAVAAAELIGYPVVLKVDSDAIAHKSEIGGVVVGVNSHDELLDARQTILARARAAYPNASIDAVLVCQQISGAHELIVGAVSDPSIGPVLLVGTGGVFVEVLKDTVLALPPVTPEHAKALLESLKIWPILAGARGRDGIDVNALADLIAKTSEMIVSLGSNLVELDINPVLVTPHGAWAADALIVLKETR